MQAKEDSSKTLEDKVWIAKFSIKPNTNECERDGKRGGCDGCLRLIARAWGLPKWDPGGGGVLVCARRPARDCLRTDFARPKSLFPQHALKKENLENHRNAR